MHNDPKFSSQSMYLYFFLQDTDALPGCVFGTFTFAASSRGLIGERLMVLMNLVTESNPNYSLVGLDHY